MDIQIVFSDRAHEHIHRDPGAVHHFDPGHGWNGGHGGPQPPPWHRGPLPVDPDEARHPDRFQKVLRAPNVFPERLRSYALQNDRTIYQRPAAPGKPGGQPAGFEDRSHLSREQGPKGGSPVLPGTGASKPQDQPGGAVIVPPFMKNPKQPGTEPSGPKQGVPDSQGTKPQGQPGGTAIVPPFTKNPKQPGTEPSGPKQGAPDSQGDQAPGPAWGHRGRASVHEESQAARNGTLRTEAGRSRFTGNQAPGPARGHRHRAAARQEAEAAPAGIQAERARRP